jgi:hypothetical protein
MSRRNPVQGSQILITVSVRDMTTARAPVQDPSTANLYDPTNGVTMSLWDPDLVLVLANQPLTRQSQGIYTLSFQTTLSSKLGLWYCQPGALDSSFTHLGHLEGAFTLVDN